MVNRVWILHGARAYNLQVVVVIHHRKPKWLQQLHGRMDLGLRVGVCVKSCLGFSLKVSLGVSSWVVLAMGISSYAIASINKID